MLIEWVPGNGLARTFGKLATISKIEQIVGTTSKESSIPIVMDLGGC